MTTVRKALRDARDALTAAGMDSPQAESQILMGFALKVAPSQLFARGDDPVPDAFFELLQERLSGIPVQHVTGVAPFLGMDLLVGPGVFIPRPETEYMTVNAAEALTSRGEATRSKHSPLIVDLCTGSGAIALSLSRSFPGATVVAVEKDPAAAQWTRKNIELFSPGVQLVMGDVTSQTILSELNGRCDVVMSNPPYVPEGSKVGRDVVYDPHGAVYGGDDGMSIINPMVSTIARLLRPGGLTFVEHDDATGGLVAERLLAEKAFVDVINHRDLGGRPRFVSACRM